MSLLQITEYVSLKNLKISPKTSAFPRCWITYLTSLWEKLHFTNFQKLEKYIFVKPKSKSKSKSKVIIQRFGLRLTL